VVWDLIAGFAAAALVSLVACRILIAAGPLDRPSLERHEHTSPTPTSGGLGIALGFGVGLILIALIPNGIWSEITLLSLHRLFIAIGFACVFLAIGLWDDSRPLSAQIKFVAFALLSLGATFAIGGVHTFPFGHRVLEAPLWLALAGTALLIFVMVNAVNFMDGANGLAMGSVTIGLIALGAIAAAHGSAAGIAVCLTAVGALCGFLYWNFPSGRLFAGDSGALFTGALAALASIVVIHRISLSPLVPAIIFFPLLADVLVTLVWRAYRRHSLLDGHSEHIYQILIRGGMSHAEIALTYWAAMAVCGGVGFLVSRDQGVAPWVALPIMAFLAIVISAVVRRFADRRGVGGV
jgi:UDP-N-acetylmuramyl pentapeptide phosphotransferase/UDP-N-acetylglucosamine-1-phosphate transferase